MDGRWAACEEDMIASIRVRRKVRRLEFKALHFSLGQDLALKIQICYITPTCLPDKVWLEEIENYYKKTE